MVDTTVLDLAGNELRVSSLKIGVTKAGSGSGTTVQGVNVAVNNVNDTTPTLAELTTSFGTPASRGAGFVGIVNDAAGDTNVYIVASSGTSYFWLKMTKAS